MKLRKVPWPDQVEGVEQDPDDQDGGLHEHEDPAADQAGEIVGDTVGEGEAAFDLAVQIAHRGMVVLVLDQVAGDVFDFSGSRHLGCFFLWLLRRNSGCRPIAWRKRPTAGYRK